MNNELVDDNIRYNLADPLLDTVAAHWELNFCRIYSVISLRVR